MNIQSQLCLGNTSLGQDWVVSTSCSTRVSSIAVHKFPPDSTSARGHSSAFTYSTRPLYFSTTILLHTFCLLRSHSAARTQKEIGDPGVYVAALWHRAWSCRLLSPRGTARLQHLFCAPGTTQPLSSLRFSPHLCAAHLHYANISQRHTNASPWNKISLLSVVTLSHSLILMMLKNVNYLPGR